MPLVFGAALVGGASGVARASDAGAGLDLTMEVIGKDERLDERVINRILIPGVPPASGNAEDAAAARKLRMDAWRQQREAARERAEERREQFRERREARREERRDTRQ
jgi:hypothetical protein